MARLALILVLLITVATTLSMKSSVERIAEQEFQHRSNEISNLISRRLGDHARILLGGAALFSASDDVTRDEWRVFNQIQKVDQLLPGIQGMGFSLRIPRADLDGHVRQIRSEGFPDYQVKPIGERDTYSAIIYLEPFTGRNLRAFGYDMLSEPVRRQAMERACDTNCAALSGKVVLVQETDTDVQPGTLMYVPVYRNGMPTETVEQRRAALHGWVYSPYRMQDLIEGIFGNSKMTWHRGFDIQVFDGEDATPEGLLYTSNPAQNAAFRKTGRFTRQEAVEFNGHWWTLRFIQNDAGVFTVDYIRVWLTLGCGLIISLLLFLLVRVLLNTRTKAQLMAGELTIELRQATERLSLATQAGGVGIWDYDVIHNRLVWDDQMFRLYGITRDQFGGAYEAWQAGVHPADRERGHAEIQQALRAEKEFDTEFHVLWPDGSTHSIRGFATVERDPDGHPLRMIGTNWDITTQKRTEQALLESEANFRTFFETMTDMILVGTPEGRILFTNSTVTRMLGYTRDELEGMHLLDMHPADKRQEAESIFAAMISGDQASCPLPLAHKDGTLVPVETRVWRGKWNGTDCLFGISKNVSAEVDLARLSFIQRELMHLATEFVNVPVERQDAAIDESLAIMGRLIDADRAYLFSYDFAAGIMSNTHEWCGPGISPEIENLRALPIDMLPDWVVAHQRGDLMHIPSVAALPADGFPHQVLAPQGIRSLITLPLMHGDACLGFVGFDAVRNERIWQQEEIALLRVLAELYAHFEAKRAGERESRELQHQLIQARDAAQSAAHAKSLFLANMSHEIRTPLNAILGYAQIMDRECRPCPTKLRLSAITRSAEHLLELLTDLLELVQNDAHQITLAPDTFDFYQALGDARLMFERHPNAHWLALELAHTPDVPRFIHADPGKVRQVLVNLLGNAVKFTTSGTVRVTASVVEKGAADEVLLAVDIQDTGCGIHPDEQARIFDVFEQAEHGKKSGKGTGLGLPLSRRYARAMGGDVTVSSRPGEGSCFRFTFNARVVTHVEATASGLGGVLRLAADQPVRHLLVVDDEPENRDMLATMLQNVGFSVDTVASAADALERISQPHAIHLVLMDLRMPEINGYEAIRRLRTLPNGRDLPVLVVTASGYSEEPERALHAGANGYVAKPVRREPLLAEISRITGTRYEYDASSPAGLHVPPVTLDGAALAVLPTAHLQHLDQALRRGDIQQLRKLIAGIESEHAGLAAALRILVDAYDYNHLRRLLDSTLGKPS